MIYAVIDTNVGLGTDPTIANKIKGLRSFGGGKHAFYRSFRVDG